jgi:hypothetical protein
MPDAKVVEWVRAKFEPLRGELDERGRLRWAAVEARSLGRGGIAAVAAATGMSLITVRKGMGEVDGADAAETVRRIRRLGWRQEALD